MSGTISVIGLGKLGLPLAACFADRGFYVLGVDINPEVVETVNKGIPHVYEPGLRELMQRVRHNLVASSDNLDEVIQQTDITIILVPTPSEDDDSFSLHYVLSVCETLGDVLQSKDHFHLVVVASTVMPGACDGEITQTLERASGKVVGRDIGLCYCPEFVALGNIIYGFNAPDFVLIGASDIMSAQLLRDVYRQFCLNDPPIVLTSLINAEIAKIALNCYTTMKITFANQLARLCEHIPGAYVDEITSAIGLDRRIGGKYFKGGTAFGGECFPRDVKAMVRVARNVCIDFPLTQLVDGLNRGWTVCLANTIEKYLPEGGTVGILGLTFKPDTDVTTESPSLILKDILEGDGISVVCYDPLVAVQGSVESVEQCIEQSSLLVVMLQLDMFKNLEFSDGQIVIDPWRFLSKQDVEIHGARYVPLGVGL